MASTRRSRWTEVSGSSNERASASLRASSSARSASPAAVSFAVRTRPSAAIGLSATICGMTRAGGAMHVAKISRRHGDREYDSYLVRRSIREGRRVRHETVANVSRLPPEAIEALTLALKGVALVPAGEAFEIVRSRKHG